MYLNIHTYNLVRYIWVSVGGCVRWVYTSVWFGLSFASYSFAFGLVFVATLFFCKSYFILSFLCACVSISLFSCGFCSCCCCRCEHLRGIFIIDNETNDIVAISLRKLDLWMCTRSECVHVELGVCVCVCECFICV